MNLPPPQRGPRHYVLTSHGRVTISEIPNNKNPLGAWRLYLSMDEAVAAVAASDDSTLRIVDVGRPGPAGLSKRFR